MKPGVPLPKKEKTVNKKSFILSALMTILVLAFTYASAEDAAPHKTLKVKLNYTGTGTVDQKYKIYVLLCDANPYTATSLVDSTAAANPPAPAAGVSHILRCQSDSGKDGAITFSDLSVSPVYALAFWDKSGSYDGVSDPASGSPAGAYGKVADKPEPIKLEEGKAVEIVLWFNDSTKTP
jgi:hypothetical protein